MSGREGAAPTTRGGVSVRGVTNTVRAPHDPADLSGGPRLRTDASAGAPGRSRSSASAPRPPTLLSRLAAHAWPARAAKVIDPPGPRPRPRPAAVDSARPTPNSCASRSCSASAHCVFPGCSPRLPDLRPRPPHPLRADSTRADHPGQTHPGNLAPLCRTHHRVKTHTAWDYRRDRDGGYAWTSPTGQHYDVTPSDRRPPTRPRPARPAEPALPAEPPQLAQLVIPRQHRRT